MTVRRKAGTEAPSHAQPPEYSDVSDDVKLMVLDYVGAPPVSPIIYQYITNFFAFLDHIALRPQSVMLA